MDGLAIDRRPSHGIVQHRITGQMAVKIRWAALGLAVLVLAMASCARDPTVAIIAPNGDGRATVRVEIANTNAAREVGLMYRKHLDPDAGMLFVFAAPAPVSFWMKNTEIPLDMVFADSDARVIGIVENAEPYSEQLLSVSGASQYVLEVNGGFCRRYGVKPGDRLKFLSFSPRASD
jgi:uncharacterized membrane protein (UPF0127 family)